MEKIVRRLEGLPLPIELAAARLRAMSVDQILQKLDDRFQLLTRGSRNAPARQQTLAQSIDWSFDLCTPPEKSLWANSSVFAGSFDLGSVEGILADEAQNDDLGDLVMSLSTSRSSSVNKTARTSATAYSRLFATTGVNWCQSTSGSRCSAGTVSGSGNSSSAPESTGRGRTKSTG